MLAANDMLDLLSEERYNEPHKDYNDDDDFSSVLENGQGDSNLKDDKVRCSDGIERFLSFKC